MDVKKMAIGALAVFGAVALFALVVAKVKAKGGADA